MAEGNLTPLDVIKGKLTNIVVPVVDKTLSMEGQAADAKAVGDALDGLIFPEGVTGELKDLRFDLDNHTHTAAEVGARPNTWMPSATQVGALPIAGGTLTGNLYSSTDGVGSAFFFGQNNIARFGAKKADGSLSRNVTLSAEAEYAKCLMLGNDYIYHTGNKPTAKDVGALSLCYASFNAMVTDLGLSLTSATTAELFNALPQKATIIFYASNSQITDLPATNGVLEVIKGPSDANHRYVLFHGVDGNLYHYKFHSSNTTNNGWTNLTNYLSLTGGTISGDVYFGGGYGKVIADSTQLQMEARNGVGDTANRRLFNVRNSSTRTLETALTITDVANGKIATHFVYHSANITCGTSDLTAGTSALTTGCIYQMYE